MPHTSWLDGMSLLSSVGSTRPPSYGKPPSYGRHLEDELLAAGRRRNSLSHPHRHRNLQQVHLAAMLLTLTSPDPLSLTLDNNLLYPPPPSNALYHLPRTLTWSGNEIFLTRSLPISTTRRTPAASRDLALYTMRRVPFHQQIALVPRREGLKSAVMHGRRSILGNMSWDVEVAGEKILRYRKGKWKTPGGQVVATEKQCLEWGLNEDDYSHAREEISIEGEGVELWMKDLIVAAWCSRIWQSNSKLSLARTLMRGQGMLLVLAADDYLILTQLL
jgi:hypothetical protein